jgi:hypothetical protein
MRIIAASVLAFGMALAGCSEDAAPEPEASPNATASGEVLGGTISDDMLPLESLRSRPAPIEDPGANADEGEGLEDAAAGAPPPADEPPAR